MVGRLLGTIGLDSYHRAARLTFGSLTLQSGIDLVPMVMGLFGVAEVLLPRAGHGRRDCVNGPGTHASTADKARLEANAARPISQRHDRRVLLGLLPGGGAMVASYVAYALAKRWSHASERFGYGAMGGVAAPEAATTPRLGGASFRC